MAGKENSDLFSQLPSNEDSLPLDFDKNTGISEPSGGETEKKTETPAPVSMKSQVKVEKAESQRRPTHHVPPPYKKTVQESTPQEPKNTVEIKGSPEVQDKPAEKPVVEAVKDKEESKPLVVAAVTEEAVQSPLSAVTSAAVSAPVEVEAPVSAPVFAAEPSPVVSVVPESVPIVQEPVIPVAAVQAEIKPEKAPSPAPKRSRNQKASRTASATAAEKQTEPLFQPQTDPKPQVPDIKQQEVKTSDIPKQSIIADAIKEDVPVSVEVSRDRKVHAEHKDKAPKSEPQKQVKKTAAAEKFSTDNATAGQLLQEGRVRSGLSVEQVSTNTKIKSAFIEALERDDFENLPASVYVNAYTRALCSLYNIDNSLVFSLLNKAKGKNLEYTVPEEVIQQLEMGKQVNFEQENKVKRIILIGVAACFTLVACISIAYYLMHAGGKPPLSAASVRPAVYLETPAKTGINAGASAKTIEEDMEKKLIAPHVFTMTSLPLAER